MPWKCIIATMCFIIYTSWYIWLCDWAFSSISSWFVHICKQILGKLSWGVEWHGTPQWAYCTLILLDTFCYLGYLTPASKYTQWLCSMHVNYMPILSLVFNQNISSTSCIELWNAKYPLDSWHTHTHTHTRTHARTHAHHTHTLLVANNNYV